ncbi:CBS domain-containing protein [Candidatus Bathyarchaeota archaeon]|nr:CBS domain-containing protein [Candidatus Bathyarchaeota archaeon]
MVSNIVKDVFSRDFISVSEEDTLSVCLSLFKGEMPPVLAVFDSRGKYKGVLARRWIIRSRLDPNTTKAKSLVRSAPTVTLNESLSKTSRLMIGSEIRQLPVYSGEKLLGFVTDENVIHGAVLEKWGNTNVEEVMNKNPFFVKEDDSVGTVLSLFREKGISHAPVVSNENLIGIIGIHDIIEHTFKPKQRQTLGERVGDKLPVLNILVKGIMVKNVITVSPETKLREAAEKMHKFNISSLVVVKNRIPVGIVTKRDFLEPLAQMDVEMRRLTVQFSLKDIEVDETQRGLIMNNFESFARKYEETLGAGTLFIYMKTHGTIYKGDQLIHCRLQLRTKKGSFFSSSEEWSVEQTFRIALNRLEKQIRPKK